jgi:hypothetical protein
MRILGYYARGSIQLQDVAECLSVAGYKTSFHTSPISSDGRLVLQVHEVNDEAEIGTTLLWRKSNEQWSDFEPETRVMFMPIWHTIKEIFDIEFSSGSLQSFSDMMSEVFRWYGGFVYFEDAFFDITNIAEIVEDGTKKPSSSQD